MNNKEKLFQELNDRMEKDLGINDELKDLDPTPEEWAELKKNLPKFFKEAIQFALIMGILLMFTAFVILQIIKLLHILL